VDSWEVGREEIGLLFLKIATGEGEKSLSFAVGAAGFEVKVQIKGKRRLGEAISRQGNARN